MKKWTEEEIDFIRNNINTISQTKLAKYFNTSRATVAKICKKLDIKSNVQPITMLEARPELIDEWDFEANSHLDINKMSCGSGIKVNWICKNNHKWQAVIADRASSRKRNCAFCAGLRYTVENSLFYKHPEIAKTWSKTKNGDKTPLDVLPCDGKTRAWWDCEKCGNSYNVLIKTKVLKSTRCPYCYHKKADKNNCFANKNKELLKEWDSNKNKGLDPYNILPRSRKLVWWKCSKCKHSWETELRRRTYKKHPGGCPKCNLSIGENRVEQVLKKYKIKYKNQKTFDGCLDTKKLKFDFYVYTDIINFCVEYNGQQHYEVVDYWDGEEGLKGVERRDNIKIKFCETKKIPLLVIPYWDFDRIEVLVMDFIKGLDYTI